TVEQVRELMGQAGDAPAPLALIDVREPWEFESGHLENAINIPLGELPLQLAQIPRGANLVFVCSMGGRSLAACQFALEAGFSSPANLEGGMMAWEQSR